MKKALHGVEKILSLLLIDKSIWIILAIATISTYYYEGYNGNYINSDGKGYYAFLPAIIIYHDLDYQFIDDYEEKYYSSRSFFDYRREIDGEIVNRYFIGLAVLWLPFFLIAHLVSLITSLPPDGFAPIYQASIAFASLFYLFLGLWALKKFLRDNQFSGINTAISLYAIVFATPLFYYSTIYVSFTHIYSFSLISVFLFAVNRYIRSYNISLLILACISLGLIILVRPTNAMIVLAIPFIAGSWNETILVFKKTISNYKHLFIGFLIVFSIVAIQLLCWKAHTGKFYVWTYTDEGFNFARPQIANVLYSYKKGLFVYTPIAFIAMFGFIKLFRRNTFQAIMLFLFLFVVTYVLSSWWNWWYGNSYGQRSFIEYLPLFAFLIAALLSECSKKWIYTISITLILISTVINLVQTYQYRYFIIHWDKMDKEKYWAVFLKTHVAYHGIHYMEESKRSIKEQLHMTSSKIQDMEPFKIVTFDFEDAGKEFNINKNIITSQSSFSGDYACILSSEWDRSPEFLSTIDSIDVGEEDIVNVSSMVYVPDNLTKNIFNIVLSIEDTLRGHIYAYYSFDGRILDLIEGEWNKIDLYYELPEIKAKNDLIKVYIWYRGEYQIYIDDFRISFYNTPSLTN